MTLFINNRYSGTQLKNPKDQIKERVSKRKIENMITSNQVQGVDCFYFLTRNKKKGITYRNEFLKSIMVFVEL